MITSASHGDADAALGRAAPAPSLGRTGAAGLTLRAADNTLSQTARQGAHTELVSSFSGTLDDDDDDGDDGDGGSQLPELRKIVDEDEEDEDASDAAAATARVSPAPRRTHGHVGVYSAADNLVMLRAAANESPYGRSYGSAGQVLERLVDLAKRSSPTLTGLTVRKLRAHLNRLADTVVCRACGASTAQP